MGFSFLNSNTEWMLIFLYHFILYQNIDNRQKMIDDLDYIILLKSTMVHHLDGGEAMFPPVLGTLLGLCVGMLLPKRDFVPQVPRDLGQPLQGDEFVMLQGEHCVWLFISIQMGQHTFGLVRLHSLITTMRFVWSYTVTRKRQTTTHWIRWGLGSVPLTTPSCWKLFLISMMI